MKYDILSPLLVHLELSAAGVLITMAIGITLGMLLKNKPKLASCVLGIADLIQTVPTLAMLSILCSILGLNNKPVVVSIIFYSMLPILRSTYVGITSVSPVVVRAARGIGMSERQVLMKVEVPLALPVILSGIRIAFVSALGIVTTGILVGSGGLGMLIWRGMQTRDPIMTLYGAVPVSVLALIWDLLTSYLENKLARKYNS